VSDRRKAAVAEGAWRLPCPRPKVSGDDVGMQFMVSSSPTAVHRTRQHEVEVTHVIAGQNSTAGARDVLTAVDVDPKIQQAKYQLHRRDYRRVHEVRHAVTVSALSTPADRGPRGGHHRCLPGARSAAGRLGGIRARTCRPPSPGTPGPGVSRGRPGLEVPSGRPVRRSASHVRHGHRGIDTRHARKDERAGGPGRPRASGSDVTSNNYSVLVCCPAASQVWICW
jgi:hypothetical protein